MKCCAVRRMLIKVSFLSVISSVLNYLQANAECVQLLCEKVRKTKRQVRGYSLTFDLSVFDCDVLIIRVHIQLVFLMYIKVVEKFLLIKTWRISFTSWK